MIPIRTLAVAGLAVASLTVSLSAGEGFERFPEETDVFVRLKSPETTVGKLAALADAVRPGAGEQLKRYNAQAAEQGADLSRDWYVAVLARGQQRPDLVFCIPATDTDSLTSSLPPSMTSQVEGDFVLFANSPQGIPAQPAESKTLSAVLSGPTGEVFDRGDVSLFVNVDHLASVYRSEIVYVQEQIQQVLRQLGEAQPTGVDMGALLKLYGPLIDGAFQALDDAGGVSVAITFDESGVGVEKYTTFDEGSVSSEVLARHPTSDMQDLSDLPADAHGYFGFSGDTRRFMEWSFAVSQSMMTEPGQKVRIQEVTEKWKQVDFGTMLFSFELLDNTQGMLRYSGIVEARPLNKVRDIMRDVTEVMGKFEGYGMKQEMKLEPAAEEIAGRSIDVLRVRQEFDSSVDPTGMQLKMQNVMFGPDGMITRIAYLSERYAVTMGGGAEAMKKLLASVEEREPTHLAAHRDGLLEEANVLVLVDLPGSIVSAITAVAAMPDSPIPVDSAAVSELTLTRSYIGFTFATEANALRSKSVVPVEQIRGMVDVIEQLRSDRAQ